MKTKVGIGPVSEGSLRDCDLIEAFIWDLEHLAPARFKKIRQQYKSLFASDEPWEDTCDENQEECSYLLESLTTALEEIAPPYTYFGASEGDGACFGFWPSLDSLEEDCRSGEVLKVSDTSEIPKGNRKMVCLVNDHGNVTLFDHKGNEVWSCV